MPADLTGRLALVTGASKGIGQATAIALARAGADVVINYKSNPAGAEATRQQVAALGRRALAVQADVSVNAQVRAMVERAGNELGAPEILINNAGWARQQAFDEITEEDWDAILAVNLKSAFLVTRACLPSMRERKWGRIVNISSGAAHFAGVVGIHYNAAKAGMEGMTRGYAPRLAKEGITINCVAPSLIDTGAGRDNEARAKLVPLGRVGLPVEVAEAVLLCVRTEYITGQSIVLNGGLYFR